MLLTQRNTTYIPISIERGARNEARAAKEAIMRQHSREGPITGF